MFLSTALMAGALAVSGTVVDAAGEAVAGAEACLLSEGHPVFCVPTDGNGFWRLPDSAAGAIRVTKSGYLAATAAVASQSAPIVLERAAALRVRVVDGGGNPIDAGTLTLVYASGRRVGPFPFNRAGMLHPSLPPGAVRVTAESDGYSLPAPHGVTLEAGREHEVVLRMTRR